MQRVRRAHPPSAGGVRVQGPQWRREQLPLAHRLRRALARRTKAPWSDVARGRIIVNHGTEADFLHFVFLCELRAGAAAPRPDLAEVSECRYWPPGALPRPISDFMIRQIQDAVAGVKFRLPSRVGPRVWLE